MTKISFPTSFSASILQWYDQHYRTFPWRISPHDIHSLPSAYATWISEIMLQQTGAGTVIPYFNRFMLAFPNVYALAESTIEHVLIHWQGLGYYRRAHHLHKAAKIIAAKGMPTTYEEWLALPGVGSYTAAAITTIAQNQPAVAVDGNIRRVFSRCFGIDGVHWIKKVSECAEKHLPKDRWGDYTQALMDLGATLCHPRQPRCTECPLVSQCRAFREGQPTCWPPKAISVQKKELFTHCYVLFDRVESHNWRVWMHPSQKEDLLKGLWRFPGSDWESVLPLHEHRDLFTFCGTLIHLFTHIRLTVHIWMMLDGQKIEHFFQNRYPSAQWIPLSEIKNYPLSRLMHNILKKALLQKKT